MYTTARVRDIYLVYLEFKSLPNQNLKIYKNISKITGPTVAGNNRLSNAFLVTKGFT